MAPQTNKPRVECNLNKKKKKNKEKKLAVNFVLEKFFIENATRKKINK